MVTDTPRKKKKRKKLARKFSEDWEIDTKSVPTIRYKKKEGILGIYQKYFGRKHSIFAMYWFLKYERTRNEESRKFYFPLKHDNMPVSGMPVKYKLLSKWQIAESDLRYLYDGPLINQHGEILVSADTALIRAQRKVKFVLPFLILISTILGFYIKLQQL